MATITIEIKAPYPPAELQLKIRARTLLEMEVVPDRTGPHMFGHTGKREGYAFTSIKSPSGKYEIRVRTKEQIAVNEINIGYNWGD